jgi:hypothetical protein
MHRAQLVLTSVVTLTGAALLSQTAFSAGEPKNQRPFTRQAAARSTQAAPASAHDPFIRGEPKNQLPFTRRIHP